MQDEMTFRTEEEYQAFVEEQERVFSSEDEYNAWVLQKLEESEQEAADPNTKWITWEEFREAVEAKLYELGCYSAAKSA